MTVDQVKAIAAKLREQALKGPERDAAANDLLNEIARRGLPAELLRIIERAR